MRRCIAIAVLMAMGSGGTAVAREQLTHVQLTRSEARRAVKTVISDRFDALAREGHTLRVGVGHCHVRATRGTCRVRTHGAQVCRMRAHVHEEVDDYQVWVDRIRCS